MPHFMIIVGNSYYENEDASIVTETVDFDRLVVWINNLRDRKLASFAQQLNVRYPNMWVDRIKAAAEPYIEWARTARVGDRIDAPELYGGVSATLLLAVPDDWPLDPEKTDGDNSD